MTEPPGAFAQGFPTQVLSGDLIAEQITEDAFLGGRLRLRQPRSGHRAGHDAVLLAAATPAQPGQCVIDFGAGVGTAGLAVAARVAGLDLVLVEVDHALAGLAAANARANAIAAATIVLDVISGADAFIAAGLPADSADVVLMNPPFNDAARHRSSPEKSHAHVATSTTLESWTHAARRTLKSGGTLSLIWRADGLVEVLAALSRGFGSIIVLPVHGDPAMPAIRVLVRATKGGRAPLRVLAALMLNPASAQPSLDRADRINEILAGKEVTALALP